MDRREQPVRLSPTAAAAAAVAAASAAGGPNAAVILVEGLLLWGGGGGGGVGDKKLVGVFHSVTVVGIDAFLTPPR